METVYSILLNDLDEHHPNPKCMETTRITGDGRYKTREITSPSQRIDVKKWKNGKGTSCVLGECRACCDLRDTGGAGGC